MSAEAEGRRSTNQRRQTMTNDKPTNWQDWTQRRKDHLDRQAEDRRRVEREMRRADFRRRNPNERRD